jgi:Ca-activated chloride channel family protein
VTPAVLAVDFADPLRLWILVAVLALAGLYLALQTRRQRYAVRFTNLDLLDSVAPESPGWRRHLPALAFLAAGCLLVLSLAGPTRQQQVPRERATIVLAIDVSLSMNADDVEPNRLEAAQDAAIGFLDDVPPKLNVGLVTFAGAATLAVAPTTDRDAVRLAIERLNLQQGTAIGEAIALSLEAIAAAPGGEEADGSDGAARSDGAPDQSDRSDESSSSEGSDGGDRSNSAGGPKVPGRIVLMSDGTTTTGRPDREGIRLARAAEVPVSTIAFGTDDGEIVGPNGRQRVPVDRPALETIADQTGGAFAEAASEAELAGVFADIGSQIGYERQTQDLTTWFSGLALVALLGCGAMSLAWFSRLP